MQVTMESIKDYDRFFERLQRRILIETDKKYRLLLEAIRQTDCPYLKQKINPDYARISNLAF
jgi:hypothetical protein